MQHSIDSATTNLISDVVTQQDESDELIEDYDESQPNPTSTSKSKKPRSKAPVERVPGHSLLSIAKVEAVVRGDGMSFICFILEITC